MVYANVFDVFIHVMEIAVAAFGAIAIVLAVALFFLNIANGRRRRRYDELRKRWSKTFRSVFTTATTTVPAFPKEDAYEVTLVFNAARELRAGDRDNPADYGAQMNALARKAGLDVYAFGLLERGDDAEKLVALTTLGQLRERKVLPTALELMDASGTELSRAAAQCALRIDRNSMRGVLDVLAKRDDWVRARVELMLREAGTFAMDSALGAAVNAADKHGKAVLVEWTHCCSSGAARAICRSVLAEETDAEVVAAALRALAPVAEQADLETAERYLRYEETFVRLAAIRVFKAVATTADTDHLKPLLADRDYWVRQRAAEAFVALNGPDSIATARAADHPDAFARSALAEAIAAERTGRNAGIMSIDRRSPSTPPRPEVRL